jgi:hypothetical protein
MEKRSHNAGFSNRLKRSLIKSTSIDSYEKKLPFLNEWSEVSIKGRNDVLQGSPPRPTKEKTKDFYFPELCSL